MKGTPPRGWLRSVAAQDAINKTHAPYLTNVTETGPATVGGRTRALVIDASNHNRFLAGGVSGGIWESTDKGSSWHALNDQQSTLSVTSLVQAPGTPLTWYFSSGEPRGNSAGISGSGIFKSTDGGATFSQLPATDIPEFDNVWKVAVRATNSDHVFAATRWDGLWRSTNAGTSWNQVFEPAPGNTDVNDLEMLPDGSILLSSNERGIYKSATGDTGSFVRLNGGLPTGQFRRIEMAFCESSPTNLYAAFEDSLSSIYFSNLKDIYRSTNGGTSWTVVDNPANSLLAGFDFPWYCFMLSVKPDDPNYVVMGSVDMVHTINGGFFWNLSAYSHADNHTGVWDKDDSNILYVGNDGGIHAYNTATILLLSSSLNNDYNVTQYYTGAYYPSGINCLGGTQDNGTWKCSNGSSAFSSVYFGDGAYCQVNQQNPLDSYASYQRGMIAKATDSDQSVPTYNSVLGALDGDQSGDVDDGAWFINPFEINLLDGEQLYFSTYKRIWRTMDGAANWVPLTAEIMDSAGKSPYSIGISRHTDPTVYIGGERSMFYRVQNAATASPGDEELLSPSVPAAVTDHFIACLEVSGLDENKVFAAMSNFSTETRIWEVNMVGANAVWTDISGDLPVGLPVNWVESDPLNHDVLMIGTDYGLYTTTNGGAQWNKETAVPNVPIHMVKFRESDRKLFIFTHGRGLWLADVPFQPISRDEPQPEMEISIVPNPASDFVSVQSEGVSLYLHQWMLLDSQGRLVSEGRNEEQIEVAALPRGVYVLSFETAGIWRRARVVLQ